MNDKKIIVITGGLGFIGSHVVDACLFNGWYVKIIDKCTYAANTHLIEKWKASWNSQFSFEKKDINDLDRIIDCDIFINCAGETHVDNSIGRSSEFVHTNIVGVHHILELLRNYGGEGYKKPLFLHFSTDEVYGDVVSGEHLETDKLKPSNPYSATKAAADQLVLAWGRTYKIPWLIVRPTNNWGINQYVEKLIPKTCKFLSLNRRVPLHNNGTPYRNWLHASDTAQAITTLIESGVTNEIFNVSGKFEQQNIDVVRKVINCYFGREVEDYENYIDFTLNRPGQDVRYFINDTKLRELGWKPKMEFDEELPNLINYYKKNFIW
jgi:dTDP-glucose 4,6-dehydratase